jgi:hypothetical protein
VSSWQLLLPDKLRQFDYDTISDVILQVSYTARDGGSGFRSSVEDALQEQLNALGEVGLMQMWSMSAEFPTEWNQFLYPTGADNATIIDIEMERFPFFLREANVSIERVELALILDEGAGAWGGDSLDVDFGPGTPPTFQLDSSPYGDYAPSGSQGDSLGWGTGAWTLTITNGDADETPIAGLNGYIDPSTVKDLVIIVHYTFTLG